MVAGWGPSVDEPRVIYVLGAGRSGSTILGLLLGQGAGTLFAGELFAAPLHIAQQQRPCSCGSDPCAFWSEVMDRLAPIDGEAHARAGRHRDLLRALWGPARTTYMGHSVALLDALAEVSGCTTIIDSSKYAARAVWLRRGLGDRLRVVYLQRSPEGLIRSHSQRHATEQRGMSLRRLVVYDAVVSLSARLARHRLDPVQLSYEDLLEAPGAVIQRVAGQLELDPEPLISALNGPLVVGHLVTANRLRNDPQVRLRTRPEVAPLSGRERLAAAAMRAFRGALA